MAAAAPLVSYEVTVTNTGSVDSDDVVLGFISPPGEQMLRIPPLEEILGMLIITCIVCLAFLLSRFPHVKS